MKTQYTTIPYNSFRAVVTITTVWFILSGCSVQYHREARPEDLNSRDTALRIRAICWVADNNYKEAGPKLVEMLLDDDRSIRFYAIKALDHLYHTRHNYDYKADSVQRLKAVKKWRAALELPNSGQEKADNPNNSAPPPAEKH